MPQLPRIPQPTKKTSRGRVVLYALLGLIAIGLIGALLETEKPKATPSIAHTILKEDAVGTTTNYHLLVPGLPRNQDSIKAATLSLLNLYCASKTCNQVYLYSDKESYDLNMYNREKLNIAQFASNQAWQRAEDKWKRKHWKQMCEGIRAIYSGYQTSELEFDPYMDSEYRKYGGKLKRLQPTTLTVTQ